MSKQIDTFEKHIEELKCLLAKTKSHQKNDIAAIKKAIQIAEKNKELLSITQGAINK